MNLNDMVIISSDDPICEPPDLFDKHMQGNALKTAPKLLTDRNGKNFSSRQGNNQPGIGLNAVVGRSFEEYGMEPNALEPLRADFSNWRHKAWTHSISQQTRPSEIFNRHFLCCFIDDAFALKHLEDVGEDIVAYETDYPHSDALWPEVPEYLWQQVRHLTPAQIDKVTHRNAMRFFMAMHHKHAATIAESV